MRSDTQAFVPLDHDGESVPLYKQIYDSVRRSILNGELESDTRLPASRVLASELGVSRMTVVNAYDQLLAEGYLESKAGSGTFVASRLPEEYLIAPKPATRKRKGSEREVRLSAFGLLLAKRGAAIRANEAAGQIVPFQHGLSALDDFPLDLWHKIVQRCQRMPLRKLISDNGPSGYMPLRAAVAEHLRSARGVNCGPEEVIITNGAQQGLDLISRILVRPATAFGWKIPDTLVRGRLSPCRVRP